MTMTASTTEFDFSVGDPITENPPVLGRSSRGLPRYVLAICVGVAATLAWQAYAQATKRAPDLGWFPEAKLMIASSLEQLGWTKLAGAENTGRPAVLESAQAATVAQIAPNKVSIDQQQLRQIAQDVAALRQVLEQVAASQRDMAAEIHNLLVTDMEMFLKIPASSPAPASSRKSTQVVPASSPARASPRKSTPAAAPSRAPDRHTEVRSADVRFRG
jgi:TolA-binding protein